MVNKPLNALYVEVFNGFKIATDLIIKVKNNLLWENKQQMQLFIIRSQRLQKIAGSFYLMAKFPSQPGAQHLK